MANEDTGVEISPQSPSQQNPNKVKVHNVEDPRAFLEQVSAGLKPDVEAAKAEKEAAYIALMDDMEASVDSRGQYFTKLGEKVDPRDGKDSRVLMLKGSETRGDSELSLVAVTRDGPKLLRCYQPNPRHPGSFQEDAQLLTDALRSTNDVQGGFYRLLPTGSKRSFDIIELVRPGGQSIDFSSFTNERSIMRDLSGDSLKKTLEKSMNRVTKPKKEQVARLREQTGAANDLAAMLKKPAQ